MQTEKMKDVRASLRLYDVRYFDWRVAFDPS